MTCTKSGSEADVSDRPPKWQRMGVCKRLQEQYLHTSEIHPTSSSQPGQTWRCTLNLDVNTQLVITRSEEASWIISSKQSMEARFCPPPPPPTPVFYSICRFSARENHKKFTLTTGSECEYSTSALDGAETRAELIECHQG